MILMWIAIGLFVLAGIYRIGWTIGQRPYKDRLSDIPWGEGKDLSELLPSTDSKFSDDSKLAELEQWWDKENLPVDEYQKKYDKPKALKPGGIVTGNNHIHFAQDMTHFAEDMTQWKTEFRKQMDKGAGYRSVVLSENYSFVPKNEHEFVSQMTYGKECDCDACTGTTNALDALRQTMRQV